MPSAHDDNSAAPRPLTSAEKKKLRSLAQVIEPRIQVGKNGITPEVIKEIDTAFKKEDLLKIRFNADRGTILRLIEDVIRSTGAECVGAVGRTAAFFRQQNETAGE